MMFSSWVWCCILLLLDNFDIYIGSLEGSSRNGSEIDSVLRVGELGRGRFTVV